MRLLLLACPPPPAPPPSAAAPVDPYAEAVETARYLSADAVVSDLRLEQRLGMPARGVTRRLPGGRCRPVGAVSPVQQP